MVICLQQNVHHIVHQSSSNQRKLHRWKVEECVEHGQKHEDCPRQAPFRMFCIPTEEAARMRWLKAINRKDYKPGKKDQVYLFYASRKYNFLIATFMIEQYFRTLADD